MADYTPNLNLEKPLGNENFRRALINGNMDKIDQKFGLEQGHDHSGAAGQGKKISYSDLENSTHKNTHASGGSDALTPGDIGAETPAGAQAKADAVQANLDAHLADYAQYTARYRIYKPLANKDVNGIFTVIEYHRQADDTLYARVTYSNPNAAGQYQTMTTAYYNAEGAAVIHTDIDSITYDADGDLYDLTPVA